MVCACQGKGAPSCPTLSRIPGPVCKLPNYTFRTLPCTLPLQSHDADEAVVFHGSLSLCDKQALHGTYAGW